MAITERVDRCGLIKRIFFGLNRLPESWLSTGIVLATTAYFQHMCFLGILAVFATILAVLGGRAIAGWMRALIFRGLCHKNYLAFLRIAV